MATTQFTARLDEADIEKFRAFVQENNITTAQGFNSLMSLLELDKSKGKISSREKEIEQFQSYLNLILKAYISSLEMNQNAENRIRDEFSDKLDLQFKLINDLNEKADDANQLLKETTKKCDDKILEANKLVEYNRKQLIEAKEVIANLNDDNEKLKEQNAKNEEVIELLKDKILKLEREQKDVRLYKQKADDLVLENGSLTKELQNLLDQTKNYEFEIEKNKLEYDKQLDKLRNEVNTIIKDRDLQLANIRAAYEKSTNALREKYFEEKEKLKDEINELKIKLNKDTH